MLLSGQVAELVESHRGLKAPESRPRCGPHRVTPGVPGGQGDPDFFPVLSLKPFSTAAPGAPTQNSGAPSQQEPRPPGRADHPTQHHCQPHQRWHPGRGRRSRKRHTRHSRVPGGPLLLPTPKRKGTVQSVPIVSSHISHAGHAGEGQGARDNRPTASSLQPFLPSRQNGLVRCPRSPLAEHYRAPAAHLGRGERRLTRL